MLPLGTTLITSIYFINKFQSTYSSKSYIPDHFYAWILLNPQIMVAHGFLARLTAAALCLIAIPTSAAPVDKRTGLCPLSPAQRGLGGGTYPRANYLSDGSIIGAYTAFANGNSIITIAHSTDREYPGLKLERHRELLPPLTLTTHTHTQLPSGRIFVAFRNH